MNLTRSFKLKSCTSRKSSKFLKDLYIKSTNGTLSKQLSLSLKFFKQKHYKSLKRLPKNKVIIFKDIPMRIIKNPAKFPDILKYADITPVFKKGNTT